ncbi:hypothetical protein PHISCL_01263 [Aspergillus sclerotialis]|uniref:MARVEL domain-containing protein n=1 Tax=Aspergillus sclerotialis TaxID=2070753 RepID=A0A3A2ZTI1_9EURO|nr:hypothetical protein PHISCL_01263 [Aspergillus sclerotialis]
MYPISNKTQCITLAFRSIALISSLISWACLIYADQEHERGDISNGDLSTPFVSPVLYCVEFAFVWSLIAIPIQFSSPYGIHPGIYVTFDPLSWISILITTIFYFILMIPYSMLYNSAARYSCRSPAFTLCNGEAVAITELVAAAFALLSVILHFGLFVWACRATDKLKKSVRAGSDKVPEKISSVDA